MNSVLGAVDELCDIEQVREPGRPVETRYFHLEGTDLVLQEPETVVTAECDDGNFGSRGMFAGGCISRNDFLRSALITGMEIEQDLGVNPIKMGVIASTDGHFAMPGAVREDQWQGAVSGEVEVSERLKPGKLPSGIKGNPGGLAGVWAEENTRESVFDAMLRRETFGTSGPRIVPRFFGGWTLDPLSCERSDLVEHGYAQGVPMGGDLSGPPTPDSKPTFVLSALRDAGGLETPLQQLQVVKGWVDADGNRRFSVHVVAGSPDNGAGVDVTTGRRVGTGHNHLCGVYTDTDFDPELPAYYYLRAVENPSPRWSLLDCLRLDEKDRPAVCQDPDRQVIQEMAWSSPIWFTPDRPGLSPAAPPVTVEAILMTHDIDYRNRLRSMAIAGLCTLFLAVLAGCAGDESMDSVNDSSAAFQQRMINADSETQNWILHGRTFGEPRFSPLDKIDVDNVGDLQLAWYQDLPGARGQEATPLVVDGVMYTTSAWSHVLAFNAATGEQPLALRSRSA